MTVDDFCRCTPLEFSEVYKSWVESERRRERAAWERTRLQCAIILQPYSKHGLKPRDVLHFDWDNEPSDDTEKLSAKEIRKRFEEVKREQGME